MSDVNPAETKDFERLLLKAWQGEVYGVHVYAALAATRTNEAEGDKLRELVRLEQHIRARLEVVLGQRQVRCDLADTLDDGDRDIEAQKSASWSQLMRWMSADAAIALQDYERLPSLTTDAPAETVDVANEVLAHERAIIAFCAKELAGEIDSLSDVRLLLREGGRDAPP
jgi:hypothetical protein